MWLVSAGAGDSGTFQAETAASGTIQTVSGVDLELIRNTLRLAAERGYAEVELETETDRFHAILPNKPKKAPKPSVAASGASAEPAGPATADVKSQWVGYYRAKEGALVLDAEVKAGDVVAVIGALGHGHDVEAPQSGKVVEVLVEDGAPVQYGQVLARIEIG